jgi:hypothetical protein
MWKILIYLKKKHNTQNGAKFELGPLLFCWKKGREAEIWNPSHIKP